MDLAIIFVAFEILGYAILRTGVVRYFKLKGE